MNDYGEYKEKLIIKGASLLAIIDNKIITEEIGKQIGRQGIFTKILYEKIYLKRVPTPRPQSFYDVASEYIIPQKSLTINAS